MSEQGTLKSFDPENIFANPYQHHSARRFRGEEFDALVEDIRVNGVHQPPPARPHPENANAVQLQMGHRRLAAWRAARPGEPFTVIVKPIGDLEMFEGCVEENLYREGLNDIERAELIEEYKKLKPEATNADMARVFRLKDPASVTNIRKLLRLPKEIQAHVAADALPDAIARQLVGVSAVNAKTAQKIADEVAAAPKSEKQDTFEQMTRNLYWNQLTDLERDHGWSLDWLADAPVIIEADLGDGDHVIGACGGCVFNVNNKCARRACFNEKFKLWAAAEVQRVAAKKQIAIAGPDEPVSVLFTGEYHDDDRAQDLLNARKEIKKVLRLAPLSEPSKRYFPTVRVLDSNAVTLVTTDKAAIDAYFAERHAAAKSNLTKVSIDKDEETDAERAKRVAQEKKEMDAKRAARSKMWRSYYDAKWLLESASRTIGEELAKTVQGPFVGFIEAEFCTNHHAYGAADTIDDQWEKQIKEAGDKADTTALRLARVALHVIAEETCDGGYRVADNEQEYMFENMRDIIQQYLSEKGKETRFGYAFHDETFGVELPDGWDVPPVHKTEFNCWLCGRFAGNMQEKLTGRDVSEDGWVVNGKDGGVFCSEAHRVEYESARYSQPSKAAAGKTSKHAKEKSKRAAQGKPKSAQTQPKRKRGRPAKK